MLMTDSDSKGAMNRAELYYSLRILRDDHLATDLIPWCIFVLVFKSVFVENSDSQTVSIPRYVVIFNPDFKRVFRFQSWLCIQFRPEMNM